MARYAMLNSDNIVDNIIELHPMNASEFPEAIPLSGLPVDAGDEYREDGFYRDGVKIRSTEELYNELLAGEGVETAIGILNGTIKEEIANENANS